MTDDFVRNAVRLDVARPADHRRHAIGSLPVGVFFTAKRSHAGIGPGVHVGPVVSAVKEDGVVGNAELVEQVEHLTNVLVVVNHYIMIFGLPASGLTAAFRLFVSAQVHMGGVHPNEERFARLLLAFDEVYGRRLELIVYRFHSLLREWPCVFYLLRAIRVRPAMQDAAGAVLLFEVRKIFVRRIITEFGLLFRVEVVEISEELVEAVHGRQMFIAIAKVILAELSGGITEGLE